MRPTLRICWIASYPKSGNTWLRFLLCNLLHGAVHATAELERLVPDLHEAPDLARFVGAPRVLVKTHLLLHAEMPLRRHTAGFVHVVRNPLDVLVSNLNYVLLQSWERLHGLAEPDRRAFADRYVDDFIAHRGDPRWRRMGMGSWIEHWHSWCGADHGLHGLSLRYEDLLGDPHRAVARLCHYFDLQRDAAAIERAIADSSFDRMREIEEREIHDRQPGFFFKPNFSAGHRSGLRFMNRGRAGTAKLSLTREQLRRAEQAFAEPMRRLGYLPAGTSAAAGG